jgi:hypothetical protein
VLFKRAFRNFETEIPLDLRRKGAALKEPSHWYTVFVLIENLANSAGYLARYPLSLERDKRRAIAPKRHFRHELEEEQNIRRGKMPTGLSSSQRL